MTEKNKDIRNEMKEAGLRHWQVADGLGLSDGNFSRKLRHELSDADKANVREIIAKLSQEGGDMK